MNILLFEQVLGCWSGRKIFSTPCYIMYQTYQEMNLTINSTFKSFIPKFSIQSWFKDWPMYRNLIINVPTKFFPVHGSLPHAIKLFIRTTFNSIFCVSRQILLSVYSTGLPGYNVVAWTVPSRPPFPVMSIVFFFFQSQFATFAYLWFTAPSSIPSTFTVFVLLFFCWILYNRFPLRFDLWVYIHHLDRFSKCLPFVFPFYSSSMIARSTQFLIFLPFFF